MKDYIVRATAANSQIRAFAATTREMVEFARAAHNTSPVATAALGRLLTAGSMMGIMMKGEKDLLTLQVKAGGPLNGMTVTADSKGNVKGYVGNPNVVIHANEKGKLDVAGAVGVGFMNVIKDMGLKEPFVGTVPIQTGEIGEDFSYYFMVSEQIPSVVSLGVLVDTTNEILSSGGFIIQLLPEASDEDISYIEEKMRNFPAVSALLNEGYTPEEMLQMIFEDVKILDSQDLFFECDCSKEKMKNALMTVGKDEIQAMIDEDHGCEMTCQFCNSKYSFSEDELKELLESIQ